MVASIDHTYGFGPTLLRGPDSCPEDSLASTTGIASQKSVLGLRGGLLGQTRKDGKILRFLPSRLLPDRH